MKKTTLGFSARLSCSIFIFLFLTVFTSQAQEICNNGIDDDSDGLIDCYDPDCSGSTACANFYFGQSAVGGCTVNGSVSYNLDTAWVSPDLVLPATTPVAADIDNDGIVEIVVCRGMTPTITDSILVLNGNTGAIETRFAAGNPVGGSKGDVIALADIDNDGFGEIVVMDLFRNLKAFEHTGVLKWTSSVVAEAVAAPSIADFNGDGIPEVYVGRQIFNGATGALIALGNGSRGEGQTSLNSVAVDVLPSAFCADCGGLELVAGDDVYAVNVTGGNMSVVVSANSQNGDGLTSVVDWDHDGDLDAVVSSRGVIASAASRLWVWDLQTTNQIGVTMTFTGNVSDLGGSPTVADFDGDGNLEVVTIGRNEIRMFDDHLAGMVVLWTRALDEDSGVGSSVAFDFDIDGAAEVVCQDQDSLFILRGSTGAVLGSLPALSGTINERPTVLDVNRDGQAEILCVGATPTFNSRTGGMMAVKPIGGIWGHARELWNQPHYFNVNINDDLSVPMVQQNHQPWPHLNTFNRQSNLLDSAGIPLPFGFGGGSVGSQFTSTSSARTASFVDQSFGSGINAWQWDFGDGNTSTQQNPSHTYGADGTYTVCLIVANACGSDTFCNDVTVWACPVPVANYSEAFVTPFDVQFSDLSVGQGLNWAWDFGDGNSSVAQNPAHTYASQGTYQVCLTVTDSCGSDTECDSIDIFCPINTPNAGFLGSVFGDSVSFQNNSTGSNLTYQWDFGDGTTSTLANPTHIYNAYGRYEVCLVVSGVCGIDSTCRFVNIVCPLVPPTANFTWTWSGSNIIVQDQSTGDSLVYSWTFNGQAYTGSNPSLAVPGPGNYVLCLYIFNECGSDTLCETIGIVSGIEEGYLSEGLTVFPNPASADLWLEWSEEAPREFEVALVDMLGRRQEMREVTREGENRFRLRVAGFAAGMYLVEIRTKEQRWLQKVRIDR